MGGTTVALRRSSPCLRVGGDSYNISLISHLPVGDVALGGEGGSHKKRKNEERKV